MGAWSSKLSLSIAPEFGAPVKFLETRKGPRISFTLKNLTDKAVGPFTFRVKSLGLWVENVVEIPVIRAFGSHLCYLEPTVEVFSDAMLENIPKQIKVSFGEKGYLSYEYDIDVPFYYFTGDIRDLQPEANQKFNIVVIGTKGMGKSSFINTVQTALSNRNEVDRTAVAGSGRSDAADGSITRTFNPHTIKGDGLHFKVWDTIGLDLHNGTEYISKLLTYMMEGFIPGGWNYNLDAQQEIEQLFAPSWLARRGSNRIHAILFFVRSTILTRPVVEEITKLVCLFNLVKQWGHNPMVVLPRIDLTRNIGPIEHLITLGRREPVMDLVCEAADIFGCNQTDVFPLVNYGTADSRRQFEVDKAAYSIIYQAVQRAQVWHTMPKPLADVETCRTRIRSGEAIDPPPPQYE